MITGYEAGAYRDLGRIANTLDRIAHELKRIADRGDQPAAELAAAQGRLNRIDSLFAGGPDTPCRTTHWFQGFGTGLVAVECVEVPLDDLRAALAGEGK